MVGRFEAPEFRNPKEGRVAWCGEPKRSASSQRPRSNSRAEIVDGGFEAVGQTDLRFPPQPVARPGDIRTALFGIVLGKGFETDAALRAGGADDFAGKLEHRAFLRISNVHRFLVLAHHQTVNAL